MRRYFISCYWFCIPCYKDLKIRPFPGGLLVVQVLNSDESFVWSVDVSIFHFIYLTDAKWRIYASVENSIIPPNDGLWPTGRQVIIKTNAVSLLIAPFEINLKF